MKYILGAIVATVFWALLFSFIQVTEERVYDCGMAEWHPDIPKEVKEECRKLRRNSSKFTV